MVYSKNGFKFTHLHGVTWEVEYNGLHFAFVSSQAVMRAISVESVQ